MSTRYNCMQRCSYAFLLPLLIVALASPSRTIAQTYAGTPGPIQDLTTIDLPLVVTGLTPANIDTIGFGLESVCVNITHTWDADVELTLVAPDGTTALLLAGVGGSGHDFAGTCLSDTAAQSITTGGAPFSGYYRPQGPMGRVNNQQDGNGTWYLRVSDTYGADTGYVHGWTITFGTSPASYYNVTATDLPLVIINTVNSQSIPNDPKIMARMGIIDNGPGNLNQVTDPHNAYDGWIGIEVRGNSSQSFPQKQYSFETRDSIGDNRETSLLGLPVENDWILYAPYSDKSCMRNHMSYELSRQMGMYATRDRYCEVILNGAYQGVYELMESIKRDSNRVDIAKLTSNDLSGDELTGGYIVKIDWIGGPYWISNFLPDQTAPYNNEVRFQMIEPDPTTAPQAQILYIQQYVDSFETALSGPAFADTALGWRRFADEGSFIDYFILNELSKNIDAYHLSTYFHKDKDSKGGKITMGPVWDFNGAWRGADYCNAQTTFDWQYNEPNYCGVDMPFWWKRLLQDTLYTNRLQCRWEELRSTVLDTANIFREIDSVATLVAQAQDRHFRQWPILGAYVWPNPSPLANTFAEENAYTKQWIIDRLAWVDANLPGTCYPPVVGVGAPTPQQVTVYPNPSRGEFHLSSQLMVEEVIVTDLLGKVVYSASPAATDCTVRLQEPGLYCVTVHVGGAVVTRKVTVLR